MLSSLARLIGRFRHDRRGNILTVFAFTITPTWAKLIDFETNVPSDVERLAAR